MRYLLLILLAVKLFALSDTELQKLALENGLKPVPSDFTSLLKVLGTDENNLSKEKITLGKKLFFEKELSLGRDINCATCHSFDKGGADGIPTAIGHKTQENPFHLNTPTFFNTAFSKKLFWNGSSESLESQAKGPLQAPFEMSITPKEAEKRLSSKEEYRDLFSKVFGNSEITFEKIVGAIAAYEKTIVTRGRYDDFLEGYLNALNQKEKEGLELFIKKSCIGCHNGIGLGGQDLRKFPMVHHYIWSMKTPSEVNALIKRYSRSEHVAKEDTELIKEGFFHQLKEKEALKAMKSKGCMKCHTPETTTVERNVIKKIGFPFDNKGGFTGAENSNLYFRVPLLRNVIRTAPYFHNGGVEKIEDAIKIMARHQQRTIITDEEVEKIVAFLKAVDGEIYSYKIK